MIMVLCSERQAKRPLWAWLTHTSLVRTTRALPFLLTELSCKVSPLVATRGPTGYVLLLRI